MIELAILGVLREQDLHGYELRKRICEVTGARSAISFGSLYPALARLEASGSVKTVEAIPSGPTKPAPMTGSLSAETSMFRARRRTVKPARGGRGRKVYGITSAGEHVLESLLDDPTLDDKSFHIKVAFCRYLTPARRLELFERRRARVADQLIAARTTRRRTGERLDSYLRSLREHDHESTERDLAWLDRLIAEERALLAAPAEPVDEGPPPVLDPTGGSPS